MAYRGRHGAGPGTTPYHRMLAMTRTLPPHVPAATATADLAALAAAAATDPRYRGLTVTWAPAYGAMLYRTPPEGGDVGACLCGTIPWWGGENPTDVVDVEFMDAGGLGARIPGAGGRDIVPVPYHNGGLPRERAWLDAMAPYVAVCLPPENNSEISG